MDPSEPSESRFVHRSQIGSIGHICYGQEISHSLDYENGEAYEFVMQELKTTQSDILGNAVCFVFEPDNNYTMDFTDETYFSFKRLLKL